jgi:FkbM family methyltransferase
MNVVPLEKNTSSLTILRHRMSQVLPHQVLQFVKKQYYAQRLKVVTEYAEPDLIVVKCFVQPGECALDVGANVGIYTKFLSHWVGAEGRVYSIEPVPMTFEILRNNIRRLGLNNVRAISCAASETSGFAAIGIPVWPSGAENFSRAAIVEKDTQSSLRHVQVRTVTLDSLLAEISAEISMGVSFIKLDVEGHELQCIKGASEIIRRWRPAWMVETWGDPRDETDAAHRIFHLMKVQGYEPFWFDKKALIKYRPGHRSMNFWFLTPENLVKLRRRGCPVNE